MLERDYLLFPSQTNLELYIQMQDADYSIHDIELVHQAYMFNLDKVYNMFRGSGKPFICHLVGVASLAVSSAMSVDIIQVALLHASYQNRVSFGPNVSLEEKQQMVSSQFGEKINQLIWAYTELEMIKIDALDVKSFTGMEEVVFLRLADEIEDLMGWGLFLHGNKNEMDMVKGNGFDRRNRMIQNAQQIQKICTSLNFPFLLKALGFWANFDSYNDYGHMLKTNKYSSYNID